jgi:acid phosphatase (class A)
MPGTTQAILVVSALVLLGGAWVERDKIPWPSWDRDPTQTSATVNRGRGYLSPEQWADSLAVLPPPPAAGSPAMEHDEAVRRSMQKLRDTSVYKLALADAALTFPELPCRFSCALGVDISKEHTPHLYRLMARMLIDLKAPNYRAKTHYKRAHPFEVDNSRTCSPDSESLMRAEGAYPSSHSAVGWAYALVLADLNPARADIILKRGRQFGQSRAVCDVQWQSDIDGGRTMGTLEVAQLNELREFQTDLAAARSEVAEALRSGVRPSLDCQSELATLASR